MPDWKKSAAFTASCRNHITGDETFRPGAAAQKWSRPRLLEWVREKIGAGHTVHTVYESCGFGYSLHEELVAARAHSIVTTPMCLSLERRRKKQEGEPALKERWYPVQVKQKDKVGRSDVDSFEAMMMREECDKGFFVAFDYSSDALAEVSVF